MSCIRSRTSARTSATPRHRASTPSRHRAFARARQRSYTQGFALLEALVAMVIVAGVGVALFALLNTGLQGLIKAEAHVATTSIQPQLLAWVRTMDLESLPPDSESTLTLWNDQTAYRAEASLERIHGPFLVTSAAGTPGIHQIALYDVTVTLYADNRRLDEIHTRRVASQQVREPAEL